MPGVVLFKNAIIIVCLFITKTVLAKRSIINVEEPLIKPTLKLVNPNYDYNLNNDLITTSE